jgi:hypothetical protein
VEFSKPTRDSFINLVADVPETVQRIVIGVFAVGWVFNAPEQPFQDAGPICGTATVRTRADNDQVPNRAEHCELFQAL